MISEIINQSREVLFAMKKCSNVFIVFGIWLSLRLADAQTIYVDTTQAPDLAAFGSKVTRVLKEWYPIIRAILPSPNFTPPTTIYIKFEASFEGVAITTEGNRIVGSVDYYRKNQGDVGSMVHELVHVIQQYKSCPFWITEGIADWVRYYFYEPDKKPGKPRADQHYTDGYGVSAYFLKYVIDSPPKLQPNMIYRVNKDCREGTYSDSMWLRLTGKTIAQYWQAMMNATEYGCYKGYCWAWCKSRGSGNWCYTTRGRKWDLQWVKCKTANECNEYWECANECH